MRTNLINKIPKLVKANPNMKIGTVAFGDYCDMGSATKITDGIYAPFSSSSKTSQLVEAAAYSRGGDMTKEVFCTSMAKAEASGDTEMFDTYAAYSKKVIL